MTDIRKTKAYKEATKLNKMILRMVTGVITRRCSLIHTYNKSIYEAYPKLSIFLISAMAIDGIFLLWQIGTYHIHILARNISSFPMFWVGVSILLLLFIGTILTGTLTYNIRHK